MVNLQTPPPSYESATGNPGGQNQFFPNAPSAIPAAANEIRPSSYYNNNITTPQNPSAQPAYRPTIYPVTYRGQQSNSENDKNMTACYIITIICIFCVVLLFALVAKIGSTSSIYNSPSYSDHNVKSNFEFDFDAWEKKHDELVKKLDNL